MGAGPEVRNPTWGFTLTSSGWGQIRWTRWGQLELTFPQQPLPDRAQGVNVGRRPCPNSSYPPTEPHQQAIAGQPGQLSAASPSGGRRSPVIGGRKMHDSDLASSHEPEDPELLDHSSLSGSQFLTELGQPPRPYAGGAHVLPPFLSILPRHCGR